MSSLLQQRKRMKNSLISKVEKYPKYSGVVGEGVIYHISLPREWSSIVVVYNINYIIFYNFDFL